jgi:hypothetical protein
MPPRHRSAAVAAALLCGLALVACGDDGDGDGGGGSDLDAFTACLEDAGLKVDDQDVLPEDAEAGLTNDLNVSKPGGPSDQEIQIGVFGTTEEAEDFLAEFPGDLKRVGSILLFSFDEETKTFRQTTSCAEQATG